MSYFITGATGFIGQQLILQLIERPGAIHVLARKGSEHKLDELRHRLGSKARRLHVWPGDITKKNLGLSKEATERLKGKVKHFFHLAAEYNILSKNVERQVLVNVEGTRNAVQFAQAVHAKCFHYCSSIAVAGQYKGYFREDMYEEAVQVEQPYFQTKFRAEGVVRKECGIPYRIYRPGIVVGHSKTGEISKIDGPYYLFPFLKSVRSILPPWMPLLGPEGARINIVPVDFVVKAMDYLAHRKGLDGRCFHLVDPHPKRVGELLNIFAGAARAPQFAMRIDARMLKLIPKDVRNLVMELPPVRRILEQIMHDLGIPMQLLDYVTFPTRFDCHDTQRALRGSRITCPPVDSYAPALWDYWERHLDPDLFRDRTLRGNVKGRVVLITGASSGIGRAVALRVAAAGGHVCLAARTLEKLKEVQAEIEGKGGQAWVYVADVSDMESCDALVKRVMKDHGKIDILINNAGKSIRRSIQLSFDRFHDFERLMRLNYFGAIRLILGVLPSMIERRSGHIINVSSIGVLANSPRFSAYVASKSALDAFSRCVRAELFDKNIRFTTINMPLVRTPMIAPTGIYDHVPALTPEQAADMVSDAIINKPRRIATRLGVFAGVMTTLFPGTTEVVLNTAYKLFPESRAAVGGKEGGQQPEPSTEAMLFASIMRGVYW
jgi:NAD(P)-dependent dehydrogenase (short-subunit alcohol dehydrogenase family)